MNVLRGCGGLAASTAAVMVALAACSSFSDGSDPTSEGAEGGSAEGSVVSEGGPADVVSAEASHMDAPAPQARCNVGAPFASTSTFTIAGYSVESARLSSDQATGFFSLCQLGNHTICTIYSSKATGGAFLNFDVVLLNTGNKYDAFATFTKNEPTMLFASTRSTANTLLFSVDLTNGTASSLPVPLSLPIPPMNSTAASQPYRLENGVVYFIAGDPNTFDIYRAKSSASADMQAAARLGALSTAANLLYAPVVSEDEREIFWGSDRPDGPNQTLGGLDVWTATNGSDAGPVDFAGPTNVPSASSQDQDHPVWLSPDACDLYLVRKDGGDVGTLWVAHRAH